MFIHLPFLHNHGVKCSPGEPPFFGLHHLFVLIPRSLQWRERSRPLPRHHHLLLFFLLGHHHDPKRRIITHSTDILTKRDRVTAIIVTTTSSSNTVSSFVFPPPPRLTKRERERERIIITIFNRVTIDNHVNHNAAHSKIEANAGWRQQG